MRKAIIGTAGRGGDAEKLSLPLFEKMFDAAMKHVQLEDELVSGGAAWADHIAVMAFLADRCSGLTLHLPAGFWTISSSPHFDYESPAGRTSEHYHALFSQRIGQDSRRHLAIAIAKGAKAYVHDGFFERNLYVGRSDKLVALTFGRLSFPADGGTRHCWEHSTAPEKIHIPIGSL